MRNSRYFKLALFLSILSLIFVGCTKELVNEDVSVEQISQETPSSVTNTKTKQLSSPTTKSGDYSNCLPSQLVQLKPKAPAQVTLGKEYNSEIEVTAVENVANVVVNSKIPQGASYVRSTPPASRQGDSLVWKFDTMKKGDVENISIWLKASQEGSLVNCLSVTALPSCCFETLVGKPTLNLTKTGPETAGLNQDIAYTISVKNTGSAVAKDVVITDNLPQGLAHNTQQRTLTYKLGDLNPGESKSIQVPVKAVGNGKVCNVANLTSSNAGELKAEACTQILRKQLQLTLNCTKEARVGERAEQTITVSNPGDVPLTNVVLNSDCPGVVGISAEGNPQVNGSAKVWRVGDLAPGASKTFRSVYTAKVDSTTGCKVNVTSSEGLSQSATCSTRWIGAPGLEITKTGPATAALKQQVSYTISVKNTGTAVAKNVVITDNLPSGLRHSTNQRSLTYRLGDMAPGAVKTMTVQLETTQRGKHCNVAVVKADNAPEKQAQACTEVLQRDVELTLECPDNTFLGKRLPSNIVISNTGDAPLTNVVATTSCPADMTIVTAEGNPERSGGQLVWRIPRVEPGQKISYKVLAIAKTLGKKCCTITVRTAEGLSKSVQCCTEWKGYPAILLEVIDTEDPLLVGEETDYVVKVTNQGTADDLNIRIVANFPNETSPLSTTGDTRGTISGKTVEFAPYPILRPKQVVTFRIRAKGVAVGDARLRVEMYSDFLKKPVREEESTHVY